MGFARAATINNGHKDEFGELIFFPGQLDRILNVNESEVTTDGTSKLVGGRPITQWVSRDARIGTGAQPTNKSGYSATFIGGSTMSGWPVPPHFQVKSLAQTEDKKN